jgi:hypothetical protein
MKPVPQELLERLRKVAPPEAEIITLPWAYEHEDYNIAVVMPDHIDHMEVRALEDRLRDVVMDWDDVYDTFSVCKVWRQKEMVYAGAH